MEKKIVLVTGSNKGIGFEVVRQLAKLGHQVILTARDEGRGTEALKKLKGESLDVHFLALDITDEESIRHVADKIKAQFGKLDVLINNAAISLRGDHSLLENDSAISTQIINTNALAQLAVTRAFHAFIPNGGRIIMVSSGGGSMSDPVGGWSPAYCVSKSFLGAITRHLAYELSSRKISVNALDPGWVKTDMGGRSAPGTVEQGADTIVWLATHEKINSGKFYRNRKEIPW
jgi:NAD(P)-dependent dehydrogenase (short-subunit alcohol dehydrogenase family)